jgi:5-methylcytosine-specific restriction endonuclease McrA
MYKTLVLNADFTPIEIIDWKQAITMLFKEKRNNNDGTLGAAFAISSYSATVKDSADRKYEIPAVIALKKYIPFSKKVAFSRIAVLARDNFQCQYCGVIQTAKELTIDHVIPRSRWKSFGNSGSSSIFTNVVACCLPCNKKKASFLMHEKGMKLIKQPKNISRYDSFINKLQIGSIPAEWSPFLESVKDEQHAQNQGKAKGS